jgi:endonuclease III-like uncharacterized protein
MLLNAARMATGATVITSSDLQHTPRKKRDTLKQLAPQALHMTVFAEVAHPRTHALVQETAKHYCRAQVLIAAAYTTTAHDWQEVKLQS